MTAVEFTNINPYIEAGAGEAYHFTYNGGDYVVECWATRNASGEDIYDATGAWVDPFDTDDWNTDDDRQEYREKLEQIQEAWSRRYAEIVQPAMTEAVTRTLQDLEGEAR